MKLFGSIGELVSLVFRLAGGKEVRVTSAAQTGGEAGVTPVEIEIPDVGAGGSDVLVTEAASQALTNKTIDASANSISNLAEGDFETKLADANKALVRDAAGDVTSALITNANVDAAAAIAESKLDLDYPTSSLNSAIDGKLDNFTSANDSRIVLTDGTSGDALKESAVVINGLGQMSGVARLDVDNVRVDGNTISSTDANGPITLEAAGTATVKGVGGDVILDATDDAVQIKAANVLVRDGAEIVLYDESDVNALTLSVPAALTSSKSVALPDLAGTVALTSGAQVITDKDIDGGTASNTSRITLPKAAKSALDGLERKEATLVYASDEDRVYVDDGSNLIPVGSDAAGSGELNVIDNPSAAVSIDGWVASGAGITVARTQTSSDLPLEGVVDTAIKITPVSGTDYVRYRWTMPASLKQRKLKLEWEQRPLSGYTSGDLKVEVYKNSASNYGGTYTEFSLSTDSSGTTSLASGTGKFQTTFDSDDADYYELRVVRVSGTTAFNIANVIVGPGQIQAVPAIGNYELGSITGIIGSNVTAPTLTGVSSSLYTKRDQNMLFMRITAAFTNANAGTGTYRILLPSGLTLDTHLLTSFQYVGSGALYGTSSTQEYPLAVHYHSSGFLQMYINVSNDWQTFTSTTPLTTSDRSFFLELAVPIAEWAGAPNYAGQNDVEYASVGGTWDADSSTTVYGPQGSAMGGALTAFRNKTITWQTPIQADDVFFVQASNDRILWVPLEGAVIANNTVGVVSSLSSVGTASTSAGFSFRHTSSTQTVVGFRRYAQIANDDSPIQDWPSSNAYWRVVKAKAGAAVGFGKAQDGNLGLVTAWTGTLSTTLTMNGTGGGTTPSINIQLQRVGNVVTAFFPAFLATSGTSSSQFSANTALPSWARPTTNQRFIQGQGQNNTGNDGPPRWIIQSNGTVIMTRNLGGSLYTNGVTCGLEYPISLTWTIA